jgi:hypothetical protein
MARRTGVANVDGGTESSAYTDDSHVWPGTPGTDYPTAGGPAGGASGRQGSGRGKSAGPKAPWSGSGGRWTVWPMRIVLWAALLIVAYRGITAIVFNETPASSGNGSGTGTAASGTTQFPVTLAEAYVMQFGRIYFNYNPANAMQRQDELFSFLPQSLLNQQQQFGFSKTTTLALQSEDVAGVTVQNDQQAVVTLLAMINGRLLEFGVPVYAAGGGITIPGLPALLASPPMVVLPQAQQSAQDATATAELQTQLAQFFQAYANGNSTELSRYLAPGASIGGLGQQVTFGSIASLNVPEGGTTRDITVTVNWILPGQLGGFATTYDMTVVEQDARWYVATIGASTQPLTTVPAS